MANFNIAVEWIMQFEDPARQYKVTPDACPGGCAGPCFAIAGINSGAFPESFKAISLLPQEKRAPVVADFYGTFFWNNWLAQLDSDELAKRVFDASVNMGQRPAVKLLQTAINATRTTAPAGSQQIQVDGGWGPVTVHEANNRDQQALVASFQNARCQHYTAICEANPGDEKYLVGWLARANK